MVYSLVFITTLMATILYAFYLWLIPKPIPGIPYNRDSTHRPLGDALDMLREVSITSEFNLWCAKQVDKLNSPICQVFVNPFSKPWVLLADFAESQDIMLRRKEFDRSKFISGGMAPLGHFQSTLPTDDTWREARLWTQDLMTPTFLNNFAGPAAYSSVGELIRLWKTKARLAQGRSFSAATDLNNVSTDTMLQFTFGDHFPHASQREQIDRISSLDPATLSIGDENRAIEFPEAPVDTYITATHEGTDYVEKAVNSWISELTMWWVTKTPRYKRVMATKNRVIREQIEISLRNVRRGAVRTGVDHMVSREIALAEKHGRSPKYGGQKFRDEVFGLTLAGLHTTSAALGWIVKFLAENQDVQSRLRSELRSAYGKAVEERREPKFEELNHPRHPYLEAVVEEALRCHSTTVTREAVTDTELLGHHIPKGTVVFCVSNGPGFYKPALPVNDSKRSPTSKAAAKPKAWDESRDLSAFYPDRWLVQKSSNEKTGETRLEFDGNSGPQLIFGAGPRGCFGRRLAYIEMRILTALTVWNFQFLQTPKELSSHAATDGISHRATQCYVRLEEM
ncbi:cytochrome p450 monooxygenase [Clohesyomyces aquaticus]|uniref:Cytochrome p450 monooxygenase n=1 Tax=Clohesyomyces aquaticus TaxID=1231657 RepID=A0A1Y1Z2C3_9PLEO|nr:cytochrome p450 monooxygenase [Clohesyomyces aquaticus]